MRTQPTRGIHTLPPTLPQPQPNYKPSNNKLPPMITAPPYIQHEESHRIPPCLNPTNHQYFAVISCDLMQLEDDRLSA
ncbi:hypothetical protein EHS13_34945 [Paenibacillus psychroresistens]|uniref:Uncharacterized protein n=1 Tax=Paenibacillus psychroresistens TaxID=1778678 RepID=A0A6B8RV12_9BACL|nr:hypothetical protein EHS13_34945 [Paenibacillus psychroresistens]